MNYNNEQFPKDIEGLFQEANVVAEKIQADLNDENCKKLNELYKVINNKTYRQKQLFEDLGYIDTESESSKKNEFKGLYVFGEEIDGVVKPMYVGISRTIYRRLRQHGWGKLPNECTFAFLKTQAEWKSKGKVATRATIKNNEMLKAKEEIQNYKVALYPIKKDFELYFLEVTLAGIFKTKWNSFRTH